MLLNSYKWLRCVKNIHFSTKFIPVLSETSSDMQIIKFHQKKNIFAVSWHYLKHIFSPQFHKKHDTNFNFGATIRCIFVVAAGDPIDKSLSPQDVKAGLF